MLIFIYVYLLLNGLIPNIQILIIQLQQTRLLSKIKDIDFIDLEYNPPISKYFCSKLINFTLLENSTGLIVDYIQSIFSSMPNLNKLTLSIRNTNDPLFCHGTNFESILTKSLPNLHQFNYTMTHRINEKTIIDDFIRWPMNYSNENNKWIHIYSRDDQPLFDRKSVTFDVNSRLLIENKFSSRITRLILNKETRKRNVCFFSFNE